MQIQICEDDDSAPYCYTYKKLGVEGCNKWNTYDYFESISQDEFDAIEEVQSVWNPEWEADCPLAVIETKRQLLVAE